MHKILSFIFLITYLSGVQLNIIKVNVDIFYESLCPDSIRFIRNQLYPIWPHVAPYVDLNLIPFGKSRSLENGERFECQHGPQECMGNRVQSCSLFLLPSQDLQVEFVNCFMAGVGNSTILQTGRKCARAVGIDFHLVTDCYHSSSGASLQLDAEQYTSLVRPSFVPTIVYNGVFDQEAQDNSLIDFKSVVCTYISINYPNACTNDGVTRL